MKAASPRIKSHARRPRSRRRRSLRLYFQLSAGLVIALLASGGLYEAGLEKEPMPVAFMAASATAPASTSTAPAETTPAAEQAASTATSTATFEPAVLTAIALESATPEPTASTGLAESPTPLPTLTPTSTRPPQSSTPQPPVMYYTQPGDTLPVIAIRFGVSPAEIVSQEEMPPFNLLNPAQLLFIPRVIGETTSTEQVLPDSEIVFSPSAVDFDIETFVKEQGGYLSTYREYLGSTGWTTGANIIKRVGLENSINPRVLLALLEYQAHWVSSQPSNLAETYYPLGYLDRDARGLFAQLSWAVGRLSIGYYGWREGRLVDVSFPDGRSIRLAPALNAGTVAVQYLFSQLYELEPWGGVLYSPEGFQKVYEDLFGNPWITAQAVEPLFPATLTQPELLLPFMPEQVWSYTGGPHAAWNKEGARAALDFAPPSMESGCVASDNWVTASATGLVVRSERGVVVLDLDGDGREQTGWAIMYLHIASAGRIRQGEWVEEGGLIGHPSCEGGNATGTHVHMARKYNGEWIPADGPLPFNLSGWVAEAGDLEYQGSMHKGGLTAEASPYSSAETHVWREVE